MQSIRNFFSDLDSRILDIRVGELFDWGYLTSTSHDGFELQNWAIFLSVASIVLSYILFRYFRRPKKRIAKMYRFRLRDFFVRNAWFSLVLLIFVFFRTQSFVFLNMRLWEAFVVGLMVLNFLFLLYQLFKVRSYSNLEKVPASEEYQKYLPKKNKKRKK